MIAFGADGVSTFKATKSSVIVQFFKRHVVFMVDVHCMTHCTNLVAQTLSNFEVVKHVEDPFQVSVVLYFDFSSSPKHTLEFQNFATCSEFEGNNILRNVKTRWISMFGLAKRVFQEYKPLVTKMATDAPMELVERNLFHAPRLAKYVCSTLFNAHIAHCELFH